MKLLSYYGGKLSVAKYENMINTYKLQKERISIGENLNIIIDNVFEGLRAFHLVWVQSFYIITEKNILLIV